MKPRGANEHYGEEIKGRCTNKDGTRFFGFVSWFELLNQAFCDLVSICCFCETLITLLDGTM